MVDNDQGILDGPSMGPEDGNPPDSIVILIHGYGANGQDLIGLASQWQALLPQTIFLAPNAPEPCPGAPGGFQWFPLTTLSKEERQEGTYGIAPLLNDYIDRCLKKFNLSEDHLALVGFSQGTMLSLHVGLRRKKQIAGILGYSGLLTAPERLMNEMETKPPVLLFHGDRDPVIPCQAMFEAVGALEAAGLKVEKHLSPNTAHNIAPDAHRKGGIFLATVLA